MIFLLFKYLNENLRHWENQSILRENERLKFLVLLKKDLENIKIQLWQMREDENLFLPDDENEEGDEDENEEEDKPPIKMVLNEELNKIRRNWRNN